MSPFWEPHTVTSTPHSACRNGVAASEETASTMRRAGWPASSSAPRTAAMSLVTPVEVSLWTTSTARICRSVSSASRAAILSGSAGRRQSPSMASTRSPRARPTSPHFEAKNPLFQRRTRSPGERTLARALSQHPVAEDGKMKTCAGSPNTHFNPSNNPSVISPNSGPRWSMTDRFMARNTRSGTAVGPGSWRKCLPLR